MNNAQNESYVVTYLTFNVITDWRSRQTREREILRALSVSVKVVRLQAILRHTTENI